MTGEATLPLDPGDSGAVAIHLVEPLTLGETASVVRTILLRLRDSEADRRITLRLAKDAITLAGSASAGAVDDRLVLARDIASELDIRPQMIVRRQPEAATERPPIARMRIAYLRRHLVAEPWQSPIVETYRERVILHVELLDKEVVLWQRSDDDLRLALRFGAKDMVIERWLEKASP